MDHTPAYRLKQLTLEARALPMHPKSRQRNRLTPHRLQNSESCQGSALLNECRTMTKPKSVCNQLTRRFPTALLVLHPETTECSLSRGWEAIPSIKASRRQRNSPPSTLMPVPSPAPKDRTRQREDPQILKEGIPIEFRNRFPAPNPEKQASCIRAPMAPPQHDSAARQFIQPGQTDSQLLPIYRARQDHPDLLRVFATLLVPRFEIDHSGDLLSERQDRKVS